jgi:hypothetical protein
MMNRRGMTLVEMLVATTMTLIIMGIVAQLFGVLGNTVNSSRYTMDLAGRLRATANKLRQDLDGMTVQTVPPVAADADAGYLEIIEGPDTDTSLGTNQILGDGDDALMFTAHAPKQQFIGTYGGSSTIESPFAEVAWFCQRSAATTNGLNLYNLYRRQLLVMSYVGAPPFVTSTSGSNSIAPPLPAALASYDLSLRRDGVLLRPNSLGDLTKRENRFMHSLSGTVSAATFPYNATVANLKDYAPLTGVRTGEDIVLTNVLAFDVRVFDPAAEIRSSTAIAVTPGDPGYGSATTPTPAPTGAYVDLGSGVGTTTLMGQADPRSKLRPLAVTDSRFYDTWSTHYECNGINEDGIGEADQGTNGVDDNNDGVIDDLSERETSPPYPVPLRGIEIRIRVYEPSSRQVRQVTVRHTFVPH